MVFRDYVDAELADMHSKGRVCRSWHEAFGLIYEEFIIEFGEEVWKKSSKRNKENALKELSQIAALCQRVAEDLDLIPNTEIIPISLTSKTNAV